MPEPVIIGNATLYCGDCLDILPTLAAESVDAVVTDPPFFMPAAHYQSRVKHRRTWGDTSILSAWWGMLCDSFLQCLKPDGYALTFCNADSYAAFFPPMFCRWELLSCLVWDKDRPGLGRLWRHQHELIIAARQSAAYLPDDGKLRADVIRCKATLSADREHPVEKPPEMLAQLADACAPPSGTVLDPFMGSGTTGVACAQTGRKFIGVEIDPGYFDIACKRIEAAQMQGRLPL